MEREVEWGIGMGTTCKPMAVSFQCMTKFTTNKKKKKIEPQVTVALVIAYFISLDASTACAVHILILLK